MFLFEGAIMLRVEFDRQCSTERRHDPLCIMDEIGKTICIKSGRDWSDWCAPAIIHGIAIVFLMHKYKIVLDKKYENAAKLSLVVQYDSDNPTSTKLLKLL